MITIKDLEDKGEWINPTERRRRLIDRGMHALNMPFPHAHEYRLYLSLGVIQYFDENSALLRDKDQVRKQIELDVKLRMLRKLYQGIHERYGRIMKLKEFLLYETRLYSVETIDEYWSPIAEIIDITRGKR